MLVSYSIALYMIALLLDLLYLWKGDLLWFQMAFWVMLFGLIGNFLANLSGVVDFMALLREAPEARQTALLHLSVG